MRTPRWRLGVLLIGACGGGGGAPADGGPGGDAGPDVDAGTAATRVGEIRVVEQGERGFAWAKLAPDGLTIWQREVMNDGTCRLLAYQPASCDEFCDGICVEHNVCAPWPTYVSAGTLTFSGLKEEVALSFGASYGYSSTDQQLGDLFDPGDPVTLVASGGEVPAFELAASGTTPVVSESIVDDKLALANGSDATFRWTPADAGARVRLTINANNQGHGAPYAAILVCDAADADGSLVIPRAMIEAFPATQAWEFCAGSDCPPSSVLRYGRDTVTRDGGQIELLVGSERLFGVEHPAP